jgi:hypothetical protein
LLLFPFKGHNPGLYYIQGYLQSQYNPKPLQSIPFLIDSMTPNSSISFADALNLGINTEQLMDRDEFTKILPNCSLFFILLNQQSVIFEIFSQMNIQYIIPSSAKEHNVVSAVPSVLGMDFLSRYRLIYKDSEMILEK